MAVSIMDPAMGRIPRFSSLVKNLLSERTNTHNGQIALDGPKWSVIDVIL